MTEGRSLLSLGHCGSPTIAARDGGDTVGWYHTSARPGNVCEGVSDSDNLAESVYTMMGLLAIGAWLADWRAMRASLAARHLPLRLPDAPLEVDAFWEARRVLDGPLPDLRAALQPLETTEAGTISRFAFPSRVASPDACNNIVPGRYYAPTRSEAAGASPFLLLLHANGCQDWDFEAWHAQRLMQRGCRVAQIALPYHLERRPARLDPRAAVMTPDLPHTLAALGQAVCDAADVLRWARVEGARRVIVAGWSLGGLVAALVAALLPLDGALLVEPAANLAWMMTHYGLFPRAIRRRYTR